MGSMSGVRVAAVAIAAAVLLPLTGCGGGESGGGDTPATRDAAMTASTTTGPPAAAADAATACTIVASSGRGLPTTSTALSDDKTYPPQLFDRVQGGVGIAAGAGQRDARYLPVSRAADRLGQDLRLLRVDDFAGAVTATIDACRAMGLPDQGPNWTTKADASVGCAAAARARDRFEVSETTSIRPSDSVHLAGVIALLRAAAAGSADYNGLYQNALAIGDAVNVLDPAKLRTTGDALLGACRSAGLPA